MASGDSKTKWRTEQVVLSVPMRGILSTTRLCHWIEATLGEHDGEVIQFGVERGKFKAKSLRRVLAKMERRRT